jgi:hypothetical protein
VQSAMQASTAIVFYLKTLIKKIEFIPEEIIALHYEGYNHPNPV